MAYPIPQEIREYVQSLGNSSDYLMMNLSACSDEVVGAYEHDNLVWYDDKTATNTVFEQGIRFIHRRFYDYLQKNRDDLRELLVNPGGSFSDEKARPQLEKDLEMFWPEVDTLLKFLSVDTDDQDFLHFENQVFSARYDRMDSEEREKALSGDYEREYPLCWHRIHSEMFGSPDGVSLRHMITPSNWFLMLRTISDGAKLIRLLYDAKKRFASGSCTISDLAQYWRDMKPGCGVGYGREILAGKVLEPVFQAAASRGNLFVDGKQIAQVKYGKKKLYQCWGDVFYFFLEDGLAGLLFPTSLDDFFPYNKSCEPTGIMYNCDETKFTLDQQLKLPDSYQTTSSQD